MARMMNRIKNTRATFLPFFSALESRKNTSSLISVDNQSMPSYSTPLKLGPLLLKNRVLMASLTRDRNIVPGPLQVEYYTQRVGAGLIFSEGTLVEPIGSEWSNARKFDLLLLEDFLMNLSITFSWHI